MMTLSELVELATEQAPLTTPYLLPIKTRDAWLAIWSSPALVDT